MAQPQGSSQNLLLFDDESVCVPIGFTSIEIEMVILVQIHEAETRSPKDSGQQRSLTVSINDEGMLCFQSTNMEKPF